MRRIVISGLIALAAVLGGVAVPVAAATDRPAATLRPASVLRPAAVGLQQNSFPRISCVTTRDCLAVEGTSSENTGATPTAMSIARWSGSAWKRARVALPKGTRSVDLSGVSCKTAKSCLVVGDYYTSVSIGANSHALALTYNGTSLRPTPAVPLPKNTAQATLSDVSCTTPTHCVAVGEASGASGTFGPTGLASLIETWNGTKWTLHTVGAPAGTLVQLSGISCVTSAYCVLAGESFADTPGGGTALTLRSWNGRKLTVMRPARVGGGTTELVVTNVSCASASNCAVSGGVVAVSSSTSTGITAFTEVWRGRAWQAITPAWPKGTANTYLVGVSCFGPHTCDAVGLAGSETAPDATAASFNGTSWALQPVPAPAKGRATAFSGVSCLSASKCVAIGVTGLASGSASSTMTGVWNGTAWRLKPGL